MCHSSPWNCLTPAHKLKISNRCVITYFRNEGISNICFYGVFSCFGLRNPPSKFVNYFWITLHITLVMVSWYFVPALLHEEPKVIHLLFKHHLGRLHCRVANIRKKEKMSRMVLCVVLLCNVWVINLRRGRDIWIIWYMWKQFWKKDTSSHGWF